MSAMGRDQTSAANVRNGWEADISSKPKTILRESPDQAQNAAIPSGAGDDASLPQLCARGRRQAKSIAKALESAGHQVWWDSPVHGGARFDAEIAEALSNFRRKERC